MASKVDKDKAIEMLASGMTYAEVGAEFGVSRQYIHQVCHYHAKQRRYRASRYEKMVYPGLANWLKTNRVSIGDLAKNTGTSGARISSLLYGKNSPTKTTIDKILRATGMTYELAFGVGGNDG